MRSRLLLTLVVVLGACAVDNETPATDSAAAVADTSAAQRTLYARLGGKDAITMVIDTFVARVAADDRINKKFARSHIPRVKAMLVEQVCAASGGPCTYTGRGMREAHLNMGVTDGEFDAMVEDLVATLNQLNVGQAEQSELLAALGAMRPEIVEQKVATTGTPLPTNFKPAPPLVAADSTRH